MHTLTVTAKDSLGNTANNSITVNVGPNTAPAIQFTNTFSGGVTGLTFAVGAPVTNQFGVSDVNLSLLEFLVNDIVIYSTNLNYGQIVIGNALVGTSTYTVRATDTCGAMSTASRTVTITPPAATMVVSNGSSWKYS